MKVIHKKTDFVLYKLVLFAALYTILAAPAHSLELIPGFQDTQPKFIIKDAKHSGICYDILRRIEFYLAPKNIVFKYPPRYTALKRIFREMEIGSQHLYCGAGYNKRRAEKLIYSKIPLYEVNNLIVGTPSKITPIKGLKDLVDRKLPVLALAGTSTYRYLIKRNIVLSKINPINVSNALNLVLRGRANFFIYHDIGLLYHIKKNFTANEFKFAADPVRRYNHWMVFSRHIPLNTIDDINAAIGEMTARGEIQIILNKYR